MKLLHTFVLKTESVDQLIIAGYVFVYNQRSPNLNESLQCCFRVVEIYSRIRTMVTAKNPGMFVLAPCSFCITVKNSIVLINIKLY